MKKILTVVCAIGLALIGRGAPARADLSTSPGKSAAYAALSGVSLTTSDLNVLSVQIEKGKKKRVLEVAITAIVQGATSDGNVVGVRPLVNGLAILEPGSGHQFMHACSSSYINCTTVGRFWLDLDAAEAANPGLFINQPLNIDAYALLGTGTANVRISLEAQLIKK